jgi:hypothetical protein
MKNMRLILPSLLLAGLVSSGCWLTSGQFTVSSELDTPLHVAGPGTLFFQQIDLNTENTYKDHKSDLKDLADCAILGTIKNNSTTSGLTIEVWLTPGLTSYTTEAALNADGTRVKVWGPLALAANESKKIDWDESSALFSKPGKTALLNEVKGDGTFTLYAKGTGTSYDFTLTNGVAVVVIDAGK